MATMRREFTPGFKREAVAPLESSGRPRMQIAAEAYRAQRADMKATSSVSRTGCCHDNAPMASFFHTLKLELVRQRRWTTRDEARRDLFASSERYCNRQPIHSALGDITPEQAEPNASQTSCP